MFLVYGKIINYFQSHWIIVIAKQHNLFIIPFLYNRAYFWNVFTVVWLCSNYNPTNARFACQPCFDLRPCSPAVLCGTVRGVRSSRICLLFLKVPVLFRHSVLDCYLIRFSSHIQNIAHSANLITKSAFVLWENVKWLRKTLSTNKHEYVVHHSISNKLILVRFNNFRFV